MNPLGLRLPSMSHKMFTFSVSTCVKYPWEMFLCVETTRAK